MIKIIKIILFLFVFTSHLKAEIVNNIVIEGNERVNEETIKIYGDIKVNKNYNDKDLNQILLNLYETNFFEEVKVDLSNGTLTVKISEYPILNQIVLLGENSVRISREIKKIIFLKEKSSFIQTKLSEDINTIKKLYASIGYNFTNVEAKIKKVDNTVDLIIEIDKGNQTRISSIKFIGDKKISDRRLRDIIASEEHKFWKILSKNTNFSKQLVLLDERLLKNYYKSNGYYDVKINSKSAVLKDDNNIDITYSIDAGKRFIFKKITTNIDPVLDPNLFAPLQKTYKKYIGQYYSPFSIKKILEEIDQLIDDTNLQFVEHNVEEILSNDTIEIKFNIYETDKILVNRIDITGNNVTNEEVIRSELLLEEGDPFSELSLDKSVSKLKARNIFSNVTSKISDSKELNQKNIIIDVEEKPTGEISAGAGIGTSGGTFAIQVSENNWLGTGNRIKFNLEVDTESLGGTLNYTDNNYNFTGNKLNYYVSSRSNDKPDQGYENTIISSGINTSFEQFRDVFLSLGLAVSYDDLRTENNASSSLKKQSGEFSEFVGQYGIKTDKRNRAFMPTSGYVTTFNQELPIYADKSAITNTFSLSNYKSITEDVIGATKIYLTAINGLNDDDVRLNKRRNLSSKRLRGFERGKVGPVDGSDHVGGNYAASLNFEASFPNLLPDSTKTEIATFLDFGNVWGVDYDDSLDDTNELRSTIGAAVSWMSPIGPMNFTLSSNLKKADTDKTQSFTFNLGTTF